MRAECPGGLSTADRQQPEPSVPPLPDVAEVRSRTKIHSQFYSWDKQRNLASKTHVLKPGSGRLWYVSVLSSVHDVTFVNTGSGCMGHHLL